MSSMLEAVRRVNLPGRVERSMRLRVFILLAVMLAAAATGFSEAAPRRDALLAVALLPVGAWVSWLRAGKPNYSIKLALAIGAILALARFFAEVQTITSVEGARRPLASLFVGVQVLHGFDLPARRDLGFTLASSLTLIALAATNTYGTWFLFVMAVYGVLGVVAMIEMQRSAAEQRAEEWQQADALAPLGVEGEGVVGATGLGARAAAAAHWNDRDLRALIKVGVMVVLLGALAFSLVPRSSTTQLGGLQFRSLPTSISLPAGLISNPGLSNGGQDAPVDGEAPLDYNPAAYFGFAQNVDLRTVGTPSDLPVMRVRADRPRLWRGMVFDTYTGIGWTRPGQDQAPPSLSGSPITLPTRLNGNREQVVQTIELLTDTPNLLFAAADARQIFVAGAVEPWDDGTLSTPVSMVEGTVYSVVSFVDVTPTDRLRGVPGIWERSVLDRWTQLPATVPQRVHDLAAQITQGAATPYAAAEAIERWLGENTEYRLDAVPPPRTGDVVDHFLFESQQGWCEPIAASMVVMLRSLGIPARFATGFQPGTRNPITGVFDVKLENAHAWVEILLPNHGWISFDPTGAVPEAVSPDPHRSIPLVDLITWGWNTLVPAPVRVLLSAIGRNARAQWPGTLVLLLCLGAAGTVLWRARREARWAEQPPFEQFERLLATTGLTRDPGQTPRQFVEEVRRRRPSIPASAATALLTHEEARRYEGPAVGVGTATEAVAVVRRALDEAQ